MKILVAYYGVTKNTELIAKTMYDHIAGEHQVSLMKLDEVTPATLDEYELVFIGSACHHCDLAKPVLDLLTDLSLNPPYKLAGFYCHATYKRDYPDPIAEEMFDEWAAKGIQTIYSVSEEKNIDFKGVFNCMGAPSREIGIFIKNTIIKNEEQWKIYQKEIAKHPSPEDLKDARMFADEVISNSK